MLNLTGRKAHVVTIMAINVRIPTPLQQLTESKAEVEAEGSTVREALDFLCEKYDGLQGRLFDDEGKLRRFINVYVNDEDIRFLESDGTAIKDGDEISIVPAIAGGY